MTRITVLAGGVGGAKFISGVRSLATERDLEITVVANNGDDLWLTGLRVCPDLDSIMYALGGANDRERGWGRADESERVSAELTAYGVGWPWFTLGDLDLGTHIARTALLREGRTLTEATAVLASRWDLGLRLLPATDDQVETFVEIETEQGHAEVIHFEEWWVKHRAAVPTRRFIQRGLDGSSATAEALSAIRDTDIVLIAPSNPVVSIGTMLTLPGFRDALTETLAPVVGVSPIIGGSPVRGMADVCLATIGVPSTAEAVARHYGSRADGGILDGWLVDSVDAAVVPVLRADGLPTDAVPLWMTDDSATGQMVRAALSMAERHGVPRRD